MRSMGTLVTHLLLCRLVDQIKLQGDRYTTTVISASLLSGSSISSTERVVSQLTIRNVTEDDSGEYTCSVPGNSTTATLTVVLEGNI